MLFGPRNGSLRHNIYNDNMETISSNVAVQDFRLTITFYNPYSATEKPWNYGLIFRSVPNGAQYRLYVDSDANWFLQVATIKNGTSTATTIQSGVVLGMNISSSGTNTLQLLA